MSKEIKTSFGAQIFVLIEFGLLSCLIYPLVKFSFELWARWQNVPTVDLTASMAYALSSVFLSIALTFSINQTVLGPYLSRKHAWKLPVFRTFSRFVVAFCFILGLAIFLIIYVHSYVQLNDDYVTVKIAASQPFQVPAQKVKAIRQQTCIRGDSEAIFFSPIFDSSTGPDWCSFFGQELERLDVSFVEMLQKLYGDIPVE